MNLGITGGRGTLGKIFQARLAAEGARFDIFGGDICHPEELKEWLESGKFDGIIHLAAIVPVQLVHANLSRAFQVNVGGTTNLVAAMAYLGAKPWLFYASSSHVYQPSASPVPETAQVAPINPYGLSKRMGEQVVEAGAPTAGIPFCIGRIFSFYHQSQTGSFLYPSLMGRFGSEDLSQPFLLMGADDVRDLSDAEAIVGHVIKLAQRRATGLINIGSGRGTSIADFAQAHAPRRLNIVKAASNPPTCLVADITRLQQILGK